MASVFLRILLFRKKGRLKNGKTRRFQTACLGVIWRLEIFRERR